MSWKATNSVRKATAALNSFEFGLNIKLAQFVLILLLAAAGWLNHGAIPQLAWITKARKRSAVPPKPDDDDRTRQLRMDMFAVAVKVAAESANDFEAALAARLKDLPADEFAGAIDQMNEASIALAKALHKQLAEL